MDKKLSLQDYEALYKNALLARDKIHLTVPKTIENLEEYQQICRVCGCRDDGHLVDLDKCQNFEFEPSISSYRILFQRTSLQFQFHTMPDLPASICATCAYKVKTFYLLTRQFVIGQNTMRTAISDYYRNKYGIEAPEQLEDRTQLRKQLAQLHKRAQQQQQICNKDLTKVGIDKRNKGNRKRSSSADSCLNAGAKQMFGRTQGQANNAATRRKNIVNCQLSKSTVSLRPQANKSPSPEKRITIKPGAATTRVQRKERVPKPTGAVECIVTPRVIKSINPIVEKSNPITIESPSRRPCLPPSKAQLQQKLQDRRKQWR